MFDKMNKKTAYDFYKLRKHNETVYILLKIKSDMVKLSQQQESVQRGKLV